MLRSRDLTGRARDQRGQLFAGEPRDLDDKVFGLRVEFRPVGEVSARRVKEPEQAAWRIVVDLGPSLGDHHAALLSPVQVITPITG
jgi:hypothetical protein